MTLEDKCNVSSVKTNLVPVLTGVYPAVSVNKMNENTLEYFVTRLVQCSHYRNVELVKGGKCVKPLWWPDNLNFHHPVSILKKQLESLSSSWHNILKDLVLRCTRFHKLEPLQIRVPLQNVKWQRELYLRPVLTSKENRDNIIAGNLQMNKKRKLENGENGVVQLLNKKAKIQTLAKPCKVILSNSPEKETVLESRCLRIQSFVKLFDILKEIPCEKEEEKLVPKSDFMQGLGLGQTEAPLIAPKNTKPPVVRLCTVPQIPFSSDLGRVLRSRETYDISEELHRRKIERMEWYFREQDVTTRTQEYEISYVNKNLYSRNYVFPRTHYYQSHISRTAAFLEYVCKPLTVQVEKIDITPYLQKQCLKQCVDDEINVVLPTVNTSDEKTENS